MKKTINLFVVTLLLTSFSFITSCSNNEENVLKYSVELEEVCLENGENYCITKQEFERIGELLDSIPPNDPCIWISITDVNNKKYSGYIRGRGASSSNSICN